MTTRTRLTAFCLLAALLALPFPAYAQAAVADGTDAPSTVLETAAPETTPETQDWNFHFQTTVVGQGYPGLSGVNGPMSLNNKGQVRETVSNTFFGGARAPWSSDHTTTEFYINPEFNQGFGLDRTAGIAAFPNGEGQKAGSDYPRFDMARYFIRQTFGFGGERENVESDQNQLAGSRDISRLTVSAGKMSVTDFFDNNSYSHDPRTQFMNLALIDGGAYDYAADQKGYSDGAVVEFNQKGWAIRYGYFFLPKYSNARDLEENYNGKGAHNLELEERYDIAGHAGIFRALTFANIGNAGDYRDALGFLDPVPDLAATRTTRVKYGFVLNAEQSIGDDLSAFARFSWNDGQEEILSYTDIDESFSGGLSLKGNRWNRPDDTVGLGGAIDMLSQAQINYLKAGGTGLMIGDGFLNYAPEDILETYYSYQVIPGLTTSADYQLVVNPAYNASRGPANIFAVRAHIEF